MVRTVDVATKAPRYYNGTFIENVDYTRFTSHKRDVVRTTRDSTGFREPMPYGADFTYFYLNPNGVFETTLFGDHRKYTGNLAYEIGTPLVIPAPGGNARLSSRAEVQALLALKDQKVNLAQAFAERKQTAKLFADTLQTITSGVRALRKADPKGFVKAVRQQVSTKNAKIPSRWLELQYGWKPLLSDVYGACEAIGETPLAAYRIDVKGNARERSSRTIDNRNTTGAPTVQLVTTEERVRCHLTYTPGNMLLERFADVGVTNPLLLAWELLPFSFVVDWALPVGNWLNSLDAAAGFAFRAGSLSYYAKTSTITEGRIKTDSFGRDDMRAHASLHATAYQTNFGRTVYSSSPIPTLPRFKNPWSSTHVANAMSLLATTFGRR